MVAAYPKHGFVIKWMTVEMALMKRQAAVSI